MRSGLNRVTPFCCLSFLVCSSLIQHEVWSTNLPPRRIVGRLAPVSTCRQRGRNGFLEKHDALSRRRNQDLWLLNPAVYGSPWGRGEREVSLLARLPHLLQSLAGHARAVPLSAAPPWTPLLLWVWDPPRYCCLERKCLPSILGVQQPGLQDSNSMMRNSRSWPCGCLALGLIFSVLFAQVNNVKNSLIFKVRATKIIFHIPRNLYQWKSS